MIEYRNNSQSSEWHPVDGSLPGNGSGPYDWKWAKKINIELGWQKYRLV